MLTHRNIISQRQALNKVWHISHRSRFLSYLPWHHSFGGLFERFTALHHGATIYQEDSHGKDLNAAAAELEHRQADAVLQRAEDLHGAGHRGAARTRRSRRRCSIRDLKFVFTAAAPLAQGLRRVLQGPRHAGAGRLGADGDLALRDDDAAGLRARAQLCRPPIPGCEIMTTEDGEILAKGPNVMKGYFRDPRARPRRSTTTAGCTPATWARSRTTACG